MTAYEMRISYWSSDGCSSDLTTGRNGVYQREINEALELLRGRRPGTIYIIPLRLEDAPLPSELGRLQYVDHFVASPLLVLAHWRHRRRLARPEERRVGNTGVSRGRAGGGRFD